MLKRITGVGIAQHLVKNSLFFGYHFFHYDCQLAVIKPTRNLMTIKTTLLSISCLMALTPLCYAQEQTSVNEPLIQSHHLPAVEAGESPPLRDIAPTTEEEFTEPRVIPLHRRKMTKSLRSTKAPTVIDPLISLQQNTALAIISPLLTFDGLSGSDNKAIFGEPYSPPDINGDVGTHHYVQMVNTLYQVFDKQTGTALTQPSKLSSLFKAAGKTGPCANQNQGDPIVLYDHLANRWLLSQFNYAVNLFGNDKPPYHECVAISKTDDPTGAYYVYDFVIPNNRFPDYPKFGVWADGYYMTAEQYSDGNFVGESVFVFDRSKMLAGKAAATNYHDLSAKNHLSVILPADLDGPPPPVGTPNYIIGFQNITWIEPTKKLRVFEVKADFSATGTGSITEKTSLTAAVFNPMKCSDLSGYCIPQPGTTKKLDGLSDRPMHRLQYRYFDSNCPLDGTTTACGSLVFNHTVRGASVGKSAVRWYLLKQDLSNQSLSISQQGTFAPDSSSRWLGSAALNKRGDLALGYSISSNTIYPSVHYAGRLVTDPKNTLTMTGIIQNGNGSQTNFPPQRWGDYSMMAVDPVDDCSFWYTNEYYSNATNGKNLFWQSRIGHFKLSDLCN
jgi:hypothetical protein